MSYHYHRERVSQPIFTPCLTSELICNLYACIREGAWYWSLFPRRKCDQFARDMLFNFSLIHGSFRGFVIRSPAFEMGAVPDSLARETIVSKFYDKFSRERMA
ncbi:MAG: hypothetical protein JWM11_6487 [Planctomycetaceae bacterium]|nr:hypothetical protein [Planctomycetaceae bacterium]